MICRDDRPDQPSDRFWWAADQAQVSQYLHSYQSRWLPANLFRDSADDLAGMLFAATRHWFISLHLNKGLLEIKRAYDPANLFRVHHGVGSEDWLSSASYPDQAISGSLHCRGTLPWTLRAAWRPGRACGGPRSAPEQGRRER